jgi:hemerythrin-like domain-containing protein
METAKKLKEAVEHHVSEEEGEIFSEARSVLGESEATRIGEQFQAQKQELLGRL